MKGPEEMLEIHQNSITQDSVTTFQCFPHLSRAITPVIVQNANIPMITSPSFFFFFLNDRMKQKNGSVHSETFKMKRQVWRKDAEINKCAHLGYTIFGVF